MMEMDQLADDFHPTGDDIAKEVLHVSTNRIGQVRSVSPDGFTVVVSFFDFGQMKQWDEEIAVGELRWSDRTPN